MIFQGSERLIVVFFSQTFIIILFALLGFIVIKRNRKRSTISLFMFYSLLGVGLIMNIIFILTIPSNDLFIISIAYNLASYFIIFPFIFILIFINVILKMEESFTLRKITLVIVIYGILCWSLYFIPEGITFTSNWTPVYSLPFFIYLLVIFTGYVTIPTIFYSIRLYTLFKARNLKNKLRLFLSGVLLMLAVIYGAIYFNTTSEPIFKTLWSIFAFFMEIAAGLLVYYGIGKDL